MKIESIGNGNWLSVPLFCVVALLYLSSAKAHSDLLEPGCEPDRQTVVYSQNAESIDGNYMPCVTDTGFPSGESGLAITEDGTLLRSVVLFPTGIAVSLDKGATWQRRNLPKGAPAFIADSIIDSATGRYFYAGAGNKPVFSSDDEGLTWHQSTFDSTKRQDWPKLFSGAPAVARANGYPTNIYYCNWTVPLGIFSQTRCFKSTDGGATFTGTGNNPYADAICKKPKQTTGVGHGRGVVDPRNGAIYLPVSYCGEMEVAVSHDEGATWRRRTVKANATSSTKSLADAKQSPQWKEQLTYHSFNFVVAELAASELGDALAMDSEGRLYAVWIDGFSYLPVIAFSTNGGETWSDPQVFSPPDVVQAAMPSINIAQDGRIGISYYATIDKWNWTGYLTITDSVLNTAPRFETAAITRPAEPLMSEPCCWVSGPLEYTAARWAPDGSLWGAFGGYTDSFFYARGVLGRLVHK